MKTFLNPSKEIWEKLTSRPEFDTDVLEGTVSGILEQVRKGGDKVLRALTLQFDKAALDSLEVTSSEIADAVQTLSPELKDAIIVAARNIETFHEAQHQAVLKIETTPGVTCWRKSVPISRVGIYAPGGSAPLFSTALMLGIPAKLAGCSEVFLCTPPDESGSISPAILYSAQVTGISRVFKLGGAQAIAAMAFGTESVPRVSKIFGPGNQFVTKAKQLVSLQGTAIDLPAGPSEVLVLADETADPAFVAADLLSQAEHGPDSQVTLVSVHKELINEVEKELGKQIITLPRKAIAEKSMAHGQVIYFEAIDNALSFINDYAPEHLIINTRNAKEIVDKIENAGSVFIGSYSPEAIGDYASGTNHTLPTSGYAKIYGGVSLDSFVKHITFQEVTAEGIRNLGRVVARMADAERLEGHKRAVEIRLKRLGT